MDVFIEPASIPQFVNAARSQYEQGHPLALCLVVDSSVPQAFVNDVLKSIPKDKPLDVFQLVTTGDSIRMGYQRLDW